MNNKKETHILIIWPKYTSHYSQITREISSNFQIEETHEVHLNLSNNEWLKKFYGRSLAHYNEAEIKQILKSKRSQTGTGKAIILKLSTGCVDYSIAQSTNGVSYVNATCLDTKKKLRDLTNSGIHLSDSLTDSQENQFHLNQLLMDKPFKSDADHPHKNHIMDFFKFLNANELSYISMRGHTYITENINALTKHKKDIDLLINKDQFDKLLQYPFITKLRNDKPERYTLSFIENSEYRTCKIDIYPTGSGIMPLDFEKKILSKSKLFNEIKSLSPLDLDTELLELYHYVFHKRYLPNNKIWNNEILKDISTKSPKQILTILNKFGLDQVIQNQYYPNWDSFPSLATLNRKPIKRRLQCTISGKKHFSYVFENDEGQIVKEGVLKNILNEYSILKDLAEDLRGIIPFPISIHTDEKCDLGVLTMSKIEGVPFHQLSKNSWNFNSFKNHLNSSLNTLRFFKKHGIQHRDINPSNLFYSKDHIMFIDFYWSISSDGKYQTETPPGLNSGFYKNPEGHDDLYSLVKCFVTKHILPPFLKKLLLSYDIDIIQNKLNSFNIIERIIIGLFLKNQKLLVIVAPYKEKIKNYLVDIGFIKKIFHTQLKTNK
ncbi:MAG: hypothetical protein NUV58_03090 [Candidatus Roizmanbacteria bacterium]|nr:hypothetical protein [Candidatus Roizmanbacteria bacterium]